MTITPFPRPPGLPDGGVDEPSTGTSAPVTGSFGAPSGRVGTFIGSYRFERLLDQFGQTAAAGVFSGDLFDVDGQHLGRASRRHTAAVDVSGAGGGPLEVRLGPVDVNLLGLMVTMNEMELHIEQHLAAQLLRQG